MTLNHTRAVIYALNLLIRNAWLWGRIFFHLEATAVRFVCLLVEPITIRDTNAMLKMIEIVFIYPPAHGSTAMIPRRA
jgi:hypothetical protein